MNERENLRISTFREIAPDHLQEFKARGLPERHFFPHHTYYLPKCGPDGLQASRRMCGIDDPNASWEVVLYATGPRATEFPLDLYFDDAVVWHRQQFGKAGQVATANLVRVGNQLYGNNYLADLVQRISRRREHKTRVENRFRGWTHMVFNSIMNFAVENDVGKIYSPTAALVIANTDRKRTVQKELFERVYDRALNQHFSVTREGNWWVIDVGVNRDRLVVPTKHAEALPAEKTICICHDIERGFGHDEIDRDRVQIANRIAPRALAEMIGCENAAGLKATYNVLGCFFDEVRTEIERDGHCLAFHSYNHQIRKHWRLTKHYYRVRRALASLDGRDRDGQFQDQLYRCRLVDRRVKGFRSPQSRVTAEWSDYNLVFRNFEWYATSDQQIGSIRPMMQNRLVKIPLRFDDFPLYKHGVPFDQWEKRALTTIERSEFIAFGMHDCYADFWLPHYSSFLKKISRLGTFKTLDAVANETLFAHGV